LCCGIFFVVWLNSAGSHTAINLFLASSSRKKYAQLEYNGGLFVWSSFGCRNHVLVAAMVRSPLQQNGTKKKDVHSRRTPVPLTIDLFIGFDWLATRRHPSGSVPAISTVEQYTG
jgi:hypothetical protein